MTRETEGYSNGSTTRLDGDICIDDGQYTDFLIASMHDFATCRLMCWDLWDELETPCPDYTKIHIIAKGVLNHLDELGCKKINLTACVQDEDNDFLGIRCELIEDLRCSFERILSDIPKDEKYHWIMG